MPGKAIVSLYLALKNEPLRFLSQTASGPYPIMTSSRGIRSAPTRGSGADPGAQSQQGSSGRDSSCSQSRGSELRRMGRNEQQRMLAESADFSGFLRGPPQGERSGEAEQWQGVLRTGQAVPGVCSRHVLFPWAPPALEWRGCLHCGVTETKVSAGCVFRRRRRGAGTACCFSSSPGPCAGGSVYAWRCRHSTKKRTSTTNRTAKRTAMAHHWRRSLVM